MSLHAKFRLTHELARFKPSRNVSWECLSKSRPLTSEECRMRDMQAAMKALRSAKLIIAEADILPGLLKLHAEARQEPRLLSYTY